MEAQRWALMGRKMLAAQFYMEMRCGWRDGTRGGRGYFITELALEVLRGAELDDLQSFLPMRCGYRLTHGQPTEISRCDPVKPKTWQEWCWTIR